MFCATPKALRITEVQDIFWGVEEDLEETAQIEAHHSALGSGPRYMICVTLFCTLSESENTRTCENRTHFRKHMDMRESHAFRVRFSHVCVFSDSHNVQQCATKSDT